jgi:hypothetical protein
MALQLADHILADALVELVAHDAKPRRRAERKVGAHEHGGHVQLDHAVAFRETRHGFDPSNAAPVFGMACAFRRVAVRRHGGAV